MTLLNIFQTPAFAIIVGFLILVFIGWRWACGIEKTKDEKFGDDVEWP